MAQQIIIVKNQGAADITIEDLGIIIPAGVQEDLHEQFDYPTLTISFDLKQLIENGELVLNDGMNDLSVEDALKYLQLTNQKVLGDNYFSKDDLKSSGKSQIHWDNITDTPALGSPNGWYEPVKFRVRGINLSSPPDNPETGNVYIDDASEYQKYDGANWDSLGSVSSNDRIIDLSDPDQCIAQFNGTDWDQESPPENNYAIVVSDDGDQKTAQYTYDANLAKWIKTGDADFVGHLNDGSGKHKANQIDIEGTFLNIAGSPTNAEEAFSGIDVKLGEQQTQLSASKIINGLLYVKDETRGNKWLSASREYLQFGRKGKTKNQYLGFGSSKHTSNNSGDRMLRAATITGISCQLDKVGSCEFHVRKNKTASNIASLNLAAENGKQDITLNVDIEAGDFLQSFLSATNRVEDPRLTVEIAWRV